MGVLGKNVRLALMKHPRSVSIRHRRDMTDPQPYGKILYSPKVAPASQCKLTDPCKHGFQLLPRDARPRHTGQSQPFAHSAK